MSSASRSTAIVPPSRCGLLPGKDYTRSAPYRQTGQASAFGSNDPSMYQLALPSRNHLQHLCGMLATRVAESHHIDLLSTVLMARRLRNDTVGIIAQQRM